MLHFITRGSLLVVLSLTLFACQTQDKPQKEEIRPNHVGKFYHILANHYNDLSKEQSAKKDWNDASLFSSKSLAVAKGEMPVPEYTRDWDVRDEAIQELVTARRMLLDNITGEILFKKPALAAKAFFSYDCWMEQEENWWKEELESCKNTFYESVNALRYFRDSITAVAEEITKEDIDELASTHEKEEQEKISRAISDHIKKAAEEKAKAEAAKIAAAQAAAQQQAAAQPTSQTTSANPTQAAGSTADPKITTTTAPKELSYTMNFGFDSIALTNETLVFIKNIAADIQTHKPSSITINGHADRAGPEAYNLKLSEKRASAIHKALLEQSGKPLTEIETNIFGFGESDPIRETEDGIKDAANRRVEVILE